MPVCLSWRGLSASNMTKYQLEVEYDYDFLMVGISCHAKDYRLCWGLNQKLGFNLEKLDQDIEIRHRKPDRSSYHSVYTWYNKETHAEYNLVLNKTNAGVLIPEQKQADYFLIVRNNFDDDIETQIREIDFVLTAFEVNVDSLKSKQNLVF